MSTSTPTVRLMVWFDILRNLSAIPHLALPVAAVSITAARADPWVLTDLIGPGLLSLAAWAVGSVALAKAGPELVRKKHPTGALLAATISFLISISACGSEIFYRVEHSRSNTTTVERLQAKEQTLLKELHGQPGMPGCDSQSKDVCDSLKTRAEIKAVRARLESAHDVVTIPGALSFLLWLTAVAVSFAPFLGVFLTDPTLFANWQRQINENRYRTKKLALERRAELAELEAKIEIKEGSVPSVPEPEPEPVPKKPLSSSNRWEPENQEPREPVPTGPRASSPKPKRTLGTSSDGRIRRARQTDQKTSSELDSAWQQFGRKNNRKPKNQDEFLSYLKANGSGVHKKTLGMWLRENQLKCGGQ